MILLKTAWFGLIVMVAIAWFLVIAIYDFVVWLVDRQRIRKTSREICDQLSAFEDWEGRCMKDDRR